MADDGSSLHGVAALCSLPSAEGEKKEKDVFKLWSTEDILGDSDLCHVCPDQIYSSLTLIWPADRFRFLIFEPNQL